MFKKKLMVGTMILMGLLLVPNCVHAADTLQGKIDEAAIGGTVTLDKDYDEYLTITKDITIDLAGHKITANADGWELINVVSSKLTIKDSVGNGKIVQTEGGNAIQLNVNYEPTGTIAEANTTEAKATVVLESGTIESNEFGVSLFNNSEFIMNGGKIVTTGNDTYAVCGNGTVDINSDNYGVNAKIVINGGTIESNNYAIYSPQKDGITIINGGTIKGTAGAVVLNRGSLTVNGGTLISSGTHTQITENVNGASGADFATNAVIAIPAKYATATEKLTVNIGGSANLVAEGNSEVISKAITENDSNTSFITAAKENADAIVTGGVFSSKIDESYIKDGLNLEKNADGTYTVKEVVTAPTEESTKTEDTIENPQTFDGILLYLGLGFLSIVGIAGASLYLKKRNS